MESKVKKAERLRRKQGFLLNLFIKPDYLESAELFVKIAKESDSENKIKYYKEAAETYLLCASEYGTWKAAECYKNLNKLDKQSMYFNKYIDCLIKIEKYMLAGQALSDRAEEEDGEIVIDLLKKAVEVFEMDGNCPYHIKKIMEKLLLTYLKKSLMKDAWEIFKYLDSKYNPKFYKLCISILAILLNKEGYSEDLNAEENEILMTLINNSDNVEECINKFSKNNVISEQVKLIFDMCLNSTKPENDIC